MVMAILSSYPIVQLAQSRGVHRDVLSLWSTAILKDYTRAGLHQSRTTPEQGYSREGLP